MSATATEREIGRPRHRKEDARLVTGQTNWTDNITLPRTTYLAILRSPMAHAKITSIDVSPARERPGVVAAFSAADFGDALGNVICAWPIVADMPLPRFPVLATDRVRYAGQPVAVVVADSRYAAADALEAIEVDYEQLPVVVGIEAAIAEGATQLHDDVPGNISHVFPLDVGDYEAAKARADVVIERTYVQQRLIPTAMEPRAVVVQPAPATGEFTVWSATQIPHILRTVLSIVAGVKEQNLRVVAPDVGGGFGSKLQVYPEEILALQVSQKIGRPVKWSESRSEANQQQHHGRGQIQRCELAATSDGKLLGLKVDLLADMGAYLMLLTPGIPELGAFMYPGIYKMDAYSFKTTGVYTNATSTDAYRGAGRPEATYVIERLMDDLAAELGVDPMELRRRNWITHEEFPYTSVAGLTYDSGNYEAATDQALGLFGYHQLREEQKRRRENGDPVQLGIGISTYTEMCGLAPSRVLASLNFGGGGWEHAEIRVLGSGQVELVTGTSPHGQGHVTSWSQIAADQLGVPFDDVTVLHSDTRIAPKGLDTYGSRSVVLGGSAIVKAAEKVRAKAAPIAAHLLEAAEEDIEFVDGAFRVRGAPGQAKTMAEIAAAVSLAHNLPDGVEPNLNADFTLDPDTFSFPHGTHLCAVEVDTETGFVKITKYVAVDDVGTVVNPLIVEGQVHGGVAQGVAQALYEEAVYDQDGNLLTTTMADYTIPSATDLPEFETGQTVTPSTTNPLGVKGVGETGTIASTPAVVNAVVDALRHLGVQDVQMPCTPERIWRALQNAGAK